MPQNYDREFKGWVSARTALGGSLNVPAVRTLAMLGARALSHASWRAWACALRESGDYYGYSLALGSAEVTLLDADQRLPRAGQRRALSAPLRAAAAGAAAAPAAAWLDAGAPPSSSATSWPTPTRARAHLRPRQRAGHALLGGGEDRHQQGHARQLVRRLIAALHRGRVGGQRQRRADARRQRHQRRGAGVGGGDAAAARAHSPAARRRRRPASWRQRVTFGQRSKPRATSGSWPARRRTHSLSTP